MDDASSWEVVLPVLASGLLTILGGFIAEWWRRRQANATAARQVECQVPQAARLVLAELDEIEATIRSAVKTGAWWTHGDRRLPTDTWNGYRDAIATLPDPQPFRTAHLAFSATNDVNWLAAGWASEGRAPRDRAALRAAWVTVHLALQTLSHAIASLQFETPRSSGRSTERSGEARTTSERAKLLLAVGYVR
jgi:hypothetical protein